MNSRQSWNLSPLVAGSLALALGLGLLLFVRHFPIRVPADLDFSQAYLSADNILHGRGIYFRSSDRALFGDSAAYLPQTDFAFTGPPWYALLVSSLGFFSPEKAAVIWAALNALTLCGALLLITKHLEPRTKFLAISAALLAAPVQGLIIVGQFTMPLVLGLALILTGEPSRPGRKALGFFLLTLRPHIGLPIIVGMIARLIIRKDRSTYAVWIRFFLISALLLGLTALVDPGSFRAYLDYLNFLNSLDINKICDSCSSLPILMSGGLVPGGGSIWLIRFFLAAIVFAIPAWWAVRLEEDRLAALILSLAALIAAPYVRNYDYVTLIPILACLAGGCDLINIEKSRLGRLAGLWAILAAGLFPYLIPREFTVYYLWTVPLLLLIWAAGSTMKTAAFRLRDLHP